MPDKPLPDHSHQPYCTHLAARCYQCSEAKNDFLDCAGKTILDGPPAGDDFDFPYWPIVHRGYLICPTDNRDEPNRKRTEYTAAIFKGEDYIHGDNDHGHWGAMLEWACAFIDDQIGDDEEDEMCRYCAYFARHTGDDERSPQITEYGHCKNPEFKKRVGYSELPSDVHESFGCRFWEQAVSNG